MTRHARQQAGAALLTALLSVALIASLAGTALWQQWRVTEVETSERARLQADWVLLGALDWGRLILREDARQGGADHLGEPWALPLKDARLSSFLAADKTVPPDAMMDETFLAGRIEDLQGRLNVRNLVEGRDVSAADLAMFERLFRQLQVPEQELRRLALGLKDALQDPTPPGTQPPLLPQRLEQLVWLGLSPESVDRLRPFVTWLPERTALNLNTASAEALSASTAGLSLSQAQALVDSRRQKHWRSLDEAQQAAGGKSLFREGQHATASRYFLVTGQLRQVQHLLQAQALVRRDGLDVRVLWRDLRALPPDTFSARR